MVGQQEVGYKDGMLRQESRNLTMDDQEKSKFDLTLNWINISVKLLIFSTSQIDFIQCMG